MIKVEIEFEKITQKIMTFMCINQFGQCECCGNFTREYDTDEEVEKLLKSIEDNGLDEMLYSFNATHTFGM